MPFRRQDTNLRIRATESRVFLFLQGPHGPFFDLLGSMLRKTGAAVWRIGFNAGDQAFWFHKPGFIAFRDSPSQWPGFFDDVLKTRTVTDLVVYGDTRDYHATAIREAKKRGIAVHVFEEGYMRPYWVTYERGGSNGHSRLMQMTIDDMTAALAQSDIEAPLPPAHWGDMRQHMFYGALYHWFVLFRNRRYRHFKPHRALPVSREFRLHLRRFLLLPFHAVERGIATRRIRRGGFPYHLALLQLEHDSSFQQHSPFSTMTAFLDEIITGFARGAMPHHHLVLKAHPLEDNRVPLRKTIQRLARAHDIAERVHFVRGGKLARLLDDASSAVTVNSTAGQQALWRGLPLRIFGKAVYGKPELVSTQPLADFFATPVPPDARAYQTYRRFLLETSQVPGGFYSTRGRRELLRHVVDMMLSPMDPYENLKTNTAASGQQLRIVP